MNNPEIYAVAKGGGSTMAQPEVFRNQLQYPANNADVLVVSAPGSDEVYGDRLTEHLFELERNPSKMGERLVLERLAHIARKMDPEAENEEINRVLASVISDIRLWRMQEFPLPALGERWMAQMFAAYTGREFVDASEIIRIRDNGHIDLDETANAARRRLRPGTQYVVPGFYGSDRNGQIRLLPRGGSDLSGAILASVLQAERYDIWSTIPGFMTADPKYVPTALLVEEVTQLEVREAANSGAEVVQRNVMELLGNSDIPIHLRDTNGEASANGTTIRNRRDWRRSDWPVVNVAAQIGYQALSVHEYDMNQFPDTTTDLYEILGNNRISYEHSATGVDDLSLIMASEEFARLPENFQNGVQSRRSFFSQPVGLLRLTGEGLAEGRTEKARFVGRALAALADNNIGVHGFTSSVNGRSATLFVEPEAMEGQWALNVLHEAIFDS